MIKFTWLPTTTMYPVSNSLMILNFLRSYLCLILISDTNMPNGSIFLNRSKNAASKWSGGLYPSEVSSLDLDVYIGQQEMGYLCRWLPLTEKCPFHIPGLNYTHKTKRVLLAIIVEDRPCTLSLFSITYLINHEKIYL